MGDLDLWDPGKVAVGRVVVDGKRTGEHTLVAVD